MRHREATRRQFRKQRLDVAESAAARGRIADVADGDIAGQLAHHLVAVEIARHMAVRAVRVEMLPVEAGDPRRFLPPVLERVEAECGHRRGALSAIHPENAALLAQFVVIERMRGQHVGPWLGAARMPGI